MANSRKTVGRLDFVLRVLLLTAAMVAFDRLLPNERLARLTFLPDYLRRFALSIGMGLIVSPLADTIAGRLADARLPRWYSLPIFFVLIFSTIPFSIQSRYWPIGFMVFALVLILGGSIPSRPAPPEIASGSNGMEEKSRTPSTGFSAQLLVSPVGFLRSLLTFICIWLPLIWLDKTFIDGLGALVAHIAYFLVGFVWFFKVLGRFEDAALSSDRFGMPYFFCALIVSMLPLWFGLINGYESLALFVAIQVPLAFLQSKPRPESPVPPPRELSDFRKRLKLRRENRKLTRKAAKPFFVGPDAFLRRLLVIACLWALLISVDNASDNWVGAWFARGGYLILSFVWLMSAEGRFKDAGWARDWYGSQFVLVVTVASMMPRAVHWVNGYGALAIFVLIQIPTVLLPSKPRPEEPHPADLSPDSSSSDEDDKCLRDPWEGIRATYADEPEITYQRPKRGFLKDRGLGVANWSPRRRQY